MKSKKIFLSLSLLSLVSLSPIISSCNEKSVSNPLQEYETKKQEAEKWRDFYLKETRTIFTNQSNKEKLQEVYKRIFNDKDIKIEDKDFENDNFKYINSYFYDKSVSSSFNSVYNEIYKERSNPTIINKTQPFYSLYSNLLISYYLMSFVDKDKSNMEDLFNNQLDFIELQLTHNINKVRPNNTEQQNLITDMKELLKQDINKIREIIKDKYKIEKVFYFYNTNLFFSSNLNIDNKYENEKKIQLKDSFVYDFINNNVSIDKMKKLINSEGFYLPKPTSGKENNITEYINNGSKKSSDFSFEILTNIDTYKDFFGLDKAKTQELFSFILSKENKSYDYFNSFISLINNPDISNSSNKDDDILTQSNKKTRIYENKIQRFNENTWEDIDMKKFLQSIIETLNTEEKTPEAIIARIYEANKVQNQEYVEINFLDTLVNDLFSYFKENISEAISKDEPDYNNSIVTIIPEKPRYHTSIYSNIKESNTFKKEKTNKVIISLISVLATLDLIEGIDFDDSLGSLLNLVFFLESYSVNFVIYSSFSDQNIEINYDNFVKSLRQTKFLYHNLFSDIEKSINAIISQL